jgi:phosphate starvation-inducible protein PhoH and related proteins
LAVDLTDVSESTLEFPDNFLLIDLCGEYDRNLSTIEQSYGVQILRRGNQLSVVGDEEAKQEALSTLKTLYQRLESGRTLEAGDIDRELRMGSQATEYPAGPVDQKELFKGGVADRIEIKTRKKLVEPRTEAQKAYVKALFEKELSFGIGPAGTGKTYLAVAVGVNMLISGKVDKIILSRPAVEAGEKLGYLPGDMKDKVDPYMQPLYDALGDFLPGKQAAKMMEEKVIEIAPLAFMRGRTLSNAFVVLDEAQNATSMQMKMFLTRLGQGSRMVITGDRTQIDLPRGVSSGLWDAERLLKHIPKISFSYFTSKDVVRHPLVAAIIEAYEAEDEQKR